MNGLKAYELVLPPWIPAETGSEINIYFDNLITGNADRYDFAAVSEIGRHLNERWTAVPDKPGDFNLRIEVYDDHGDRLSAADTVIHVRDKQQSGHAKRILLIGDSITGAGRYTQELLQLFARDNMPYSLAGSRGSYPNVHEGRGGWTVSRFFIDQESPFVTDGAFSFKHYINTHNIDRVTDVGVFLGINDIFHPTADHEAESIIDRHFAMLEAMFEDIRRFNSGIHIHLIMPIPPSRFQDSFGYNYGAGQTRKRFKRNLLLWNAAILKRFSQRAGEGITLIPAYVNLDTVHSMETAEEAVNSRNSSPVIRQSNGVHPAEAGYLQIADIIYYGLKNQEERK